MYLQLATIDEMGLSPQQRRQEIDRQVIQRQRQELMRMKTDLEAKASAIATGLQAA